MRDLLLVDDEPEICDLIARGLAHAYTVFSTAKPETAFEYAIKQQPAVALVDVGLGDQDGVELCRRLRNSSLTKQMAILMITGNPNSEKMMLAFDAGADDYIEKPIDLNQLEVRLKSRIRRIEDLSPRHPSFGNVTLIPERNEIELEGKAYRLSPLEFDLLRVFIANPNRSISRDELLSTIWQDVRVSNRTVDVHISALRRKLSGFQFSIESIYGSGYILRVLEEGKSRN